jgi:hypothetical protein
MIDTSDYKLFKSFIKDLDLNLLTKLPSKIHDDYEEYKRDLSKSNTEDEEE